ncbi:hypothetical protein H072_10001 [Dactylellina haptotyla CBS 200.50]|uniref:GLEYA adhesin domain-containing protein n=1 Tax=Dactylellina haptotyla (strain CBS 200.50) TaxID=1284197 RepID=S8A5T4_DACHA|nr:hypothetical protein H072_10001 [Dactylellina haptotyla CBS 200.50]
MRPSYLLVFGFAALCAAGVLEKRACGGTNCWNALKKAISSSSDVLGDCTIFFKSAGFYVLSTSITFTESWVTNTVTVSSTSTSTIIDPTATTTTSVSWTTFTSTVFNTVTLATIGVAGPVKKRCVEVTTTNLRYPPYANNCAAAYSSFTEACFCVSGFSSPTLTTTLVSSTPTTTTTYTTVPVIGAVHVTSVSTTVQVKYKTRTETATQTWQSFYAMATGSPKNGTYLFGRDSSTVDFGFANPASAASLFFYNEVDGTMKIMDDQGLDLFLWADATYKLLAKYLILVPGGIQNSQIIKCTRFGAKFMCTATLPGSPPVTLLDFAYTTDELIRVGPDTDPSHSFQLKAALQVPAAS